MNAHSFIFGAIIEGGRAGVKAKVFLLPAKREFGQRDEVVGQGEIIDF
jgi:hypothetical protein